MQDSIRVLNHSNSFGPLGLQVLKWSGMVSLFFNNEILDLNDHGF